MLERAEKIYAKEGVFGSDDKTVRGAETFKVIGAEVRSDQRARDSGLVSVGSLLAKRVPTMALSLRAAALPVISRTLASRLAGSWISILMFRRCPWCILAKIFALGNRAASDSNEVIKLSRSTAEELVLASILGLVAASDISVPYDTNVYATDASNSKGAIIQLSVDEELSKTLWLGGDKRGAYTMLDNRSLDEDLDDSPIASDLMTGPNKVIPFEFDFVEIFGGSGVLSEAMAKLGLKVCPPIDLARSPHHDISNPKLLDWIFQMIAEKEVQEPYLRTALHYLFSCSAPCLSLLQAALWL